MQLIQTLKKKYLQAEQKVKQRTHAIDLLVSGQTEANQRSIANRRNIKELRDRLTTLEHDVYFDTRDKIRFAYNDLQGLKRTITWLKAWLLGLTIFTIVMMVFLVVQMF